MAAPLPPNEPERLEELYSLEVLDTGINQQLELITQVASRSFGTPIALVSLVDAERQWFKAKTGLAASETPREQAFCAHAILDRETMVVKNAAEDERFADNPLVTGDPRIRFYAGAPLITQNGFPIGTLCVIDTEPRIASEEDLKTLRQLAALAVGILQNESKQTKLEAEVHTAVTRDSNPDLLISSLRHELRTPIRHIVSFSELLQTELADDDTGLRQKGFIDIIRQSGEHLSQLIDNLVRYEQSPFSDSLLLEPVDIGTKTADVVQSFTGTVAEKTQTLSFDEPAGRITAHADATSLRQILINLIMNASQYTPENGAITVSVSVNSDQSGCLLEIRDNGPGMPLNVLTGLGKPFVRGVSPSETHTEGVGLGLHITKRLCDAMNGSLTFTPNLGGGTCATVRLPLAVSEFASHRRTATA